MLKSERGQAQAPVDSRPTGWARRWRTAWPFAAWGGALLVAAVVLFWCYLRQSQTSAVNSDGSGAALQGWDMLHGNLLLSGWWLADVTFYTFEVPMNALAEAFGGLNPDVVHVAAALTYTLLVLTAALLARGKARGGEGIIRALLGAGILVAPAFSLGTHVLLLSPDHIGIGVPILATLLVVDRAPQRWWVAVAVCVMLTWAQVDDPLATYAAAYPMALVCGVRAIAPLARRRRPGWYDACLAVAALVSVQLTHHAISAIHAAGGYSMQPLTGANKVLPSGQWGFQFGVTMRNVLLLFGADFFDRLSGIQQAIAILHFIGVALALAGLLIGIAGLFGPIRASWRVRRRRQRRTRRPRRPPRIGTDRVSQVLTVGVGATLVAGIFVIKTALIFGAHEVAVVLPLGAVLAGRTVGPWLAHRRLPRLTLAPVLAVALACYLAALGYNASPRGVPAETQGLADWLTAHHLTSGLGRYWVANSTTLASGGRVRVAAVTGTGLIPYPWVTKPAWYEAGQSYANFVVATDAPKGDAYAFPEAGVRHVFGDPVAEYSVGQYVVMVYSKNLLLQMPPPEQAVGVH